MDKARETEMLNFKAGSDREVGKRAYDSLFLPVASRDPELRIQNAKRSWGGDAAGYRRHTDFAEGKLYNEAGRVFDIYSAPRLRTSAQIDQDIKEQYHRDLSGVADTYFDRVRLASAGVQSTALIPGAGPVLAAPATAVSTGLDATVAVGESVRAAVDPYMENKAGTLAQDYASIIAPGNLGAAKKTFKTFESQIDVMAKMPGAKTIGRLGTPITAYQLGDAGVAVGQMALPKVSPEYAKMQAESARRLQQSAQSTSYWDQTQGIRTDLGYKNHVDTPLVSLSPIERQAAVEMYEISKGVSTNLGGPVGISEFVTQEPANLQPQPQPQSQPQQQPAASSSGSNSIYEVGG